MAGVHCTQAEMEQRARAELERRNQRSDINQMMAVSFVRCSAAEHYLELNHQMADWEVNVMGTMHGGLISFLLDATMAITCRAYTGDQVTPTLDIHVNFLRPVKQGAAVCSRATVVHVGRSIVSLTAELWTESRERLCATASATFFRVDKPKE